MNIFREYAAMQFYRMDCISDRATPIRWGCLREDLKAKYLAKADLLVGAWADDEESARKRREENDHLIDRLKALPLKS